MCVCVCVCVCVCYPFVMDWKKVNLDYTCGVYMYVVDLVSSSQ